MRTVLGALGCWRSPAARSHALPLVAGDRAGPMAPTAAVGESAAP